MEYPKIDSLYKREFTTIDPQTGAIKYIDKGKSGNRIIEGDYARKEFESVKYWTVTEKVDGTNIRIEYNASGELAADVTFHGRTARASIPSNLFKHLQKTFPLAKFQKAFPGASNVVLFGEGYGGAIQLPPGKRDNPYGEEVSFILFDAYIDGWWLDVSKTHEIAVLMDITSVPLLDYEISKHTDADMPENNWVTTTYIWNTDQIVSYIKSRPKSRLGEHIMEGVVARSFPQMLFREKAVISTDPVVHADYHVPIMFKLKCRDFDGMS